MDRERTDTSSQVSGTQVSGTTRLTALLGSPVAHSLSPLLQNEAFRLVGIDCRYFCFDIDEERLPGAVDALICLQAAGWNCTMPDKYAMAKLCDELDPEAAFMQSVNTVKNVDGYLIGYSTDGAGFVRELASVGTSPAGKKITLLGAGGAARAILTRSALEGAEAIRVFNRRGEHFTQTEELAGRLAEKSHCRITLSDYSSMQALKDSIAESDILVNATSVGMGRASEECLIPDAGYFHPGLTVADIIYSPLRTKLLRMASEAGCAACNGVSMLVGQGAESFRIWTGKEMPVEQVTKVLEKEIRRRMQQ
ncbi:MAG: shikimate dehydrogenase [Lachnospiraceae bacterium]|jgi:quinate/shikimate dehydrogenase